MGDHQLLQEMRRSAALGPARLASDWRPSKEAWPISNSATRQTPASDSASCQFFLPSTLAGSQHWEQGRGEGVHRNISDFAVLYTPAPPTYIQHRGQVPGPTGEFQLHIALLQGGEGLLPVSGSASRVAAGGDPNIEL